MSAPKKAVDTSCVNDLRRLSFDRVEPEAAFFFGTPDESENPTSAAYAHYPRIDVASLRAKLDVLRPWKLEEKIRPFIGQ